VESAPPPQFDQPESEWLRSRAEHRRLTTLTFNRQTTYVVSNRLRSSQNCREG